MDERREERIGNNEALFRLVNERLEDVNDAFGSLTGDFEIVCECGDIECHDRLIIARDEYEDLRRNPLRFAIVHGHIAVGVEDLVVRRERYSVVQKHPGSPANVAEATKPAER